MNVGRKIRELRLARRLTLRDLATRIGVGSTYLCKIENQKLPNGRPPSKKLIHKLADELGANEEELLLVAGKFPDSFHERVCERPDVFRAVACMSNRQMDRLLDQLGEENSFK